MAEKLQNLAKFNIKVNFKMMKIIAMKSAPW